MDIEIRAVAPHEAAAFRAQRRGRNLALLVALLAFSALFYAIAMAKMGKLG